MLVGKALWAHHHKKAHMICELSPYACMPNTMSIGAMAGVLGKYPDLLYAPLEIKGDAEVHALSRCQMILTEAKKRAAAEFDEALRAHRPDRRRGARSSRRAPRDEASDLSSAARRAGVGTAANLVAARRRRRPDGARMKIVGMDVGSTTVKAVVVEDGEILWQDYQRHNTRQAEKVLEFLARMEAECGLDAGPRPRLLHRLRRRLHRAAGRRQARPGGRRRRRGGGEAPPRRAASSPRSAART